MSANATSTNTLSPSVVGSALFLKKLNMGLGLDAAFNFRYTSGLLAL
jgi:hypothetical protein